MFIPDPLLEEAAFLAAAVREGLLPARRLMTLVHARAETNRLRFDLVEALRSAEEVDRLTAAGANLPLAGVPFVIAGSSGEKFQAALEKEGAIHLGKLDTLPEASNAVRQGVAAIAVSAGADPEMIVGCHVHALITSKSDAAFLARSCRDLALAADAAAGGQANDAFCRPLTGEVGRGLGSLAIALMRSEGGRQPAIPARLNSHRDGRGMVLTLVDAADPTPLDRFDAAVSQRLPQRGLLTTQLFLPPSEPGSDEGLWITARSSDITIRIGSALDAARLIEA